MKRKSTKRIENLKFVIRVSNKEMRVSWKKKIWFNTFLAVLGAFFLVWISGNWLLDGFNNFTADRNLLTYWFPWSAIGLFATLFSLFLCVIAIKLILECCKQLCGKQEIIVSNGTFRYHSTNSIMKFWEQQTHKVELPESISCFASIVHKNENRWGYSVFAKAGLYCIHRHENQELPVSFDSEEQTRFVAEQLNLFYEMEPDQNPEYNLKELTKPIVTMVGEIDTSPVKEIPGEKLVGSVEFHIERLKQCLQIEWKNKSLQRDFKELFLLCLCLWLFLGVFSLIWADPQIWAIKEGARAYSLFFGIPAGLISCILLWLSISYAFSIRRHLCDQHCLTISDERLTIQSRTSVLFPAKNKTLSFVLPDYLNCFSSGTREVPFTYWDKIYFEHPVLCHTFDNETLELPIQFEDEPQAQFLAAQLNEHFQLENGPEV